MPGGSTINPNLLPYLPPSYLNSQGGLAVGVSVATATAVAQQVEADDNAIPTAAGRKLFLDMVDDDSAQLAPTGGEPPADLDSVLSSLANAAQSTSLANFLAEGVNPALLAEVIIDLANDQETQALQNQVNDDEQAEAGLVAQAGEETSAASALQQGAMEALVMACVSAAISILAAGIAIGGASGSLKDLSGLGEFGDGSGGFGDEDAPPVGSANDSNDYNVNEDDDDTVGGSAPQNGGDDNGHFDPDDPTLTGDPTAPTGTDLTRSERLEQIRTENARTQGLSQGLSALATLTNALGNYDTTMAQSQSQTDQAVGSTDAAVAQQAQAVAAQAQTVVQSIQTLIAAMIQLAQEISSAVSEKMQSITKA